MNQGNTRLARRLLWIAGIANLLLLVTLCADVAMFGSGVIALMLFPLGFGLFSLVYASSQGLWFEMSIERTWKKVCAGIKFKAKARSYRNGVYGAYARGDTKTIYPKLRDVHGTPDKMKTRLSYWNSAFTICTSA